MLTMSVVLSLATLAEARGDEQQFRTTLIEASRALESGFLAEAERLFEQALALQPESRDARFGVGALYIQQGRYTEAIDVMETLKEEFPDDYTIINNLAWLYATASDHSVRDGDRAVQLAQEALLLQPNNFHVWSTLSEGHYVSGAYERAERAAQEAVRLSREAGADRERVMQYQQQLEKCRRAAEALTILE